NDVRSGSQPETGYEVTREDVRDYYSKAALATQESLCCPVNYDPGDLSHIPPEVMEISYGCGSPVNRASLVSGESMVDLGSGGGVDVFIAAKIVGPQGKAIGIDMTEKMLEVARKNARQVSKNLGYSNIEFKQGFLESIPLEDTSVNVVTSNCVVNLSTNKQEVFKEIFRILKPGGRFVIADIISDRPVPQAMRSNRELWGECVSGALTLDEFTGFAKGAGLHGFILKKDYLWKVVEGIRFYAYILTAYKPEPVETSCCPGKVQVVYGGPLQAVTFQHIQFPLGVAVEVDEDFAKVLGSHPYREMFNIHDPDESPNDDDSCCS
ncbi:MAG: methyltransferase domain-containing protein, partial [Nitrospinaceae bacterium]|nr:methyltransferase domain-containing protein [Nitrospinaceae bacterium]NIR54268.1 methyltransferase domain-containing protein [Nitrospinaceae bacterium]NIS84685.1 methyltransferase domain-containing protein [Nitrospinaceae bacterium]NIT81480.1 methyltransferase domain-containing protein [Nitrospinaceae bacterium]NIU43764.1 methyltransferase domain-containing protein [Nitrospinaceae bacterium]